MIENLDWHDVITRYDRPHTLFYCDPPYWQTEGYGNEFNWDQYEALEGFMTGSAGTVILPINDHPDIRKLFSNFHIVEFEYEYTLSCGGDTTSGTELVIGWVTGPERSNNSVLSQCCLIMTFAKF